MIHVQHLLGIGHLQRAALLAEALARRGFPVELVSGGMPTSAAIADGVGFRQLPPARSPDVEFSQLVEADGRPVDDAWRLARRRQLLDLFDSLEPRALITETFPFGRNMLRFELIPLLKAARRSAACELVVSSIRDILQPKTRPGRSRETCELIERYYDRVLVHGDPSIARLEDSFDAVDCIRDKIAYSGYIAGPGSKSAIGGGQSGEVLVSAGGSATGLKILETAISARPLTSLADRHWRILVSPAIGGPDFNRLEQRAGDNTTVERNRGDFAGLMRRAALSVSQAGYNTVCDLLGSDTAAVVVPFADGDELEQSLRARRLQEHGRLLMLEPRELAPDSLAAAIERAMALDARIEVDLDGARHSAELIERWLETANP
ncbi:MAG: glycosyltransferase [Gammaproteobacteria bacterium]|jgi:predicted glycosyltransferase